MSSSQEKIARIEHYATYDRKRNVNSSYRSNKNDGKHVNNEIAGTKSTSQLRPEQTLPT